MLDTKTPRFGSYIDNILVSKASIKLIELILVRSWRLKPRFSQIGRRNLFLGRPPYLRKPQCSEGSLATFPAVPGPGNGIPHARPAPLVTTRNGLPPTEVFPGYAALKKWPSKNGPKGCLSPMYGRQVGSAFRARQASFVGLLSKGEVQQGGPVRPVGCFI